MRKIKVYPKHTISCATGASKLSESDLRNSPAGTKVVCDGQIFVKTNDQRLAWQSESDDRVKMSAFALAEHGAKPCITDRDDAIYGEDEQISLQASSSASFTRKDVMDFLRYEDSGYLDYNQRVEDVATEFNISKEEAEHYVFDYLSAVIDDEDPSSADYERIASKTVSDSDGFNTDYTWYRRKSDGLNVFVFGDNDLYRPEDEDWDWETESDDAAQEWFDSYHGFDDDNDYGDRSFDDEDIYSASAEQYSEMPLIDWFSNCKYDVIEAGDTEDGEIYVVLNHIVNDKDSVAEELSQCIEDQGEHVIDWNTNGGNVFVFDTISRSDYGMLEHASRSDVESCDTMYGSNEYAISDELDSSTAIYQDKAYAEEGCDPEVREWVYEWSEDVGDAESGPIVHNYAELICARSKEEAEEVGRDNYAGEGFCGGEAHLASQQEIDNLSAIRWPADDDMTDIMNSSQLMFPWKMVGEYADGHEATVTGENEADCMDKLISLTDKHGDLTWYSGYNDEDYVDGEYIGEENFIYSSEKFETSERYFVYEEGSNDPLTDGFMYQEDAENWVSSNYLGGPVEIKVHRYYRDDDGGLNPDGDPKTVAVMSAEDTEFEEYEDDIKEIDQEFTSENTSINSTKLPAIFHMVNFEPGTINIDYGGGRFDNVADYLTQYDVINLVYDPYNRSKEHNAEVISTVKAAGGADTATCSNVLNVIKEPEVRLNVLQNMKKLVKSNGKVYITVYEGTGKGDEGPTKSGYQLNRRTADYMEEILQVFPNAKRKGKLIICTNSDGSSPVESAYYGGAYDIDSDSYFTKDDLMEFADNVVENLNSNMSALFDLGDISITNNLLHIEVFDTDEYTYSADVKIDMRSIRRPADIMKYVSKVVKNIRSDYDDIHSEEISSAAEVNGFNKLIYEIKNKLSDIMTSPNFGYGADEIDEYTAVEMYDTEYGKCIEVRAEVSYDGLMDIAEQLDAIVQKYDKDAYFDAEDAGILQAYLSIDSIESCKDVVTAGKYDIPEPSLEPREDTSVFSEEITESVVVALDGIIAIVDDEGGWEYENVDELPKIIESDEFVLVEDESTIEEMIDDILMPFMPMKPGRYELTAEIEFVFDLNVDYDGTDMRYGYDPEILEYDVEYDSRESDVDKCIIINKDTSEVVVRK